MAHNYGAKYKSARDRLLDLLLDLAWHTHKEMEGVAGNRYAARLLELKRLGYKVESRVATSASDGKEHRLLSRTPGPPQPKRVKVFLHERDADALTQGHVTLAAKKATTSALASFRVNKDKL